MKKLIDEVLKNPSFSKSDGIVLTTKVSEVSYPENGNDECFQLEEKSFWFRHRNQVILDQVKIELKEGTILDVGGGNGYVTKAMQDNGYDAILLEPNFSGCYNARNRGVKSIINSSFEQVNFENEKPDCICAFDVIEHIEDECRFLNKCYNSLNVGGKLVLAVPALQFIWSEEDVRAGHYRRYSKKSLLTLVKNIGFEVTFCSYFFSILPIPIFLFRSLFFHLNINTIKSMVNSHRRDFKLLNAILNIEEKALGKRKEIPFGSSLILIAEK